MKKNKLVGIAALLLAMGLVGCDVGSSEPGEHVHNPAAEWSTDANYHWHACQGEECTEKLDRAKHTWIDDVNHPDVAATCQAAGKDYSICSICGKTKEVELTKLEHEWEDYAGDADHVAVAGNCQQEGKRFEKCKNCPEIREIKIEKGAHAFGESGTVVDEEGLTKYSYGTCTGCGQYDVILDALDWTKMEGSNKDASGETLKLNKNDNYTEYEFNFDGTLTGSVWIYGWVDYFKDGQNNNDQRGFWSRKSGQDIEGGARNLEVTVNDVAVEITNVKTYEEMGMASRESGTDSTFALCELGTANLKFGRNKVVYKRIESYNLNITQIHFIGTYAAHTHDGTPTTVQNSDGKTVKQSVCSCGLNEIGIAFQDGTASKALSGDVKLDKGATVSWKIKVDKEVTADLSFFIKVSSADHVGRHFYNEALEDAKHEGEEGYVKQNTAGTPDKTTEDAWRYTISVGDTEFPITNLKTWGENGLSYPGKTSGYVTFGSVTLAAGENVLKLKQNSIGYRLLFPAANDVKLSFNGDAVIVA